MLIADQPGRTLGWDLEQKQGGMVPSSPLGCVMLVFLHWRHMPGGLWLRCNPRDDRQALDIAPRLGPSTEKR